MSVVTGIGRINHIGIVTPSIEDSVRLYREILGATVAHEPFDMPEIGVRICFIDVPNSQIELIEPLGNGSPVDEYLAANPTGGQHHVCFEVPDIQDAVADLAAKGVEILFEPRIGAHGTPITFIDPKSMGGVLVELMETPRTSH